MENTTTTTRPRRRAERTDMDDAKLAGRRRRRLLGSAAAGAALLLLASTAWACTLRTGTLEACRAGASPASCSTVSGASQQTQTGSVDDGGSSVDVTGEGFLENVPYTITWAKPGAPGNCHRPTVDGQTSLLASGLIGPDFSTTVTTPSSGTGTARLCAQDFRATGTDQTDNLVVTGNVLTMTVAML